MGMSVVQWFSVETLHIFHTSAKSCCFAAASQKAPLTSESNVLFTYVHTPLTKQVFIVNYNFCHYCELFVRSAATINVPGIILYE